MRDADVEAVEALATLTFEDLDRRRGVPPPPRSRVTGGQVRMRRVLTTDPAGCWVADGPDGELAGAALAIVREGVWGLSMFVVRPGLQSAGLGGALLGRALDHGAGARGGIILSSPDPRALRVYRRAGFALHPVVSAAGAPGGMTEAPGVRPFTAADHAMAAAVDRRARGAAHAGDLDAIVEAGAELLALPGRGYVGHRDGKLILLAAADEDAAAALLRTALARMPAGIEVEISWMTGAQGWAIDVALAAGLELRVGAGAVALRGETGTFHPYLPSGAYL